jgi:hypothetical protein
MSNAHSAAGPALGYQYQADYGLLTFVRDGEPGRAITLELHDDIAWDDNGTPMEQLQVKHSVAASSTVGDTSPQIWRTLKAWLDAGSPANLDGPSLVLVTTSTAVNGSAAYLLRDDSRDAPAAAKELFAEVALADEFARLAREDPGFSVFEHHPLGGHGVEAARYLFGKELEVRDVFAWGATLVHGDRTTGEDNAVAMIKFANGGISITEASWSMKGGMELRNEITGTEGRLVTDTLSTPIRGFISNPAGYLIEKADAETGWVYPLPDEARAYGYSQELRHFIDCFRTGAKPREDFVDGYVVNCALDACYRSMRSGRWEPIVLDPDVVGAPDEAAVAG